MATSLQEQLRKLKTPQTNILDAKTKTGSLLFSSSEAANYDRDVYYDIGWSGFQELLSINGEFEQFKETLFGKASRDLQRVVETKETNEKLDKLIEGFLLMVSPYLEKQAALKAIEWLINRFMINEMNAQSLFMCIFPYYESALFVRVLQLINVSDETGEWHWLEKARRNGLPLPKQTVFTHWGHSQEFRAFLADYLEKICKVHKKESNLKMAIAFYTSTVIGGLCILDKVKEEHISSIMRSTKKCLRSPHSELIAGMYFIIMQLNIKAKLQDKVFNIMSKNMLHKSNPPEALRRPCMLTILVMCHHQAIRELSPEVASAIDKKPELLQEIEELAKTKSVAPFMSAFILAYVRWLCSDACTIENDEKEKKVLIMLGRLGGITLSSSDASQVIWSLFEAVEDNYETIEKMSNLNLGSALNELESSHPEGYGAAMAKLINWDKVHSGKKVFKLILKEVVESGTEDSRVNFKHLVHPDDTIREAAAKAFAKNVKKGLEKDENVIKIQMESMLNDQFPKIVSTALILDDGLELLDTSYIVRKCEELLERAQEHKKKWGTLQTKCLNVLCNKLTHRYKGDELMNVLYICLPYIIFLKDQDCEAAKLIVKSKVTLRIPLLAALSLEISPMLQDFNEEKYRKNIFGIVTKAISELLKEEESSLWSYVEKQLNAEQGLFNCFVSLILLRCGLKREKMENHQCLTLAHMLLDACMAAFDAKTKNNVKEVSDEDGTGDHLGSCLEAVRKGALSLQFLSKCLNQSVKVFKLPEMYVTNTFWTTSTEDGIEEGNVLLLIKALKGAVQLERFGDTGASLRNALVSVILMEALGTIESRYHFLSVIWGWQSSLKFSNYVDDALQIWSLKLGASLLNSQSSSLAWALGASQPLVPSLLSALMNPRSLVRQEAMNCLKELSHVVGGHLTQDSHGKLLKLLIKHEEEIVSDVGHISEVLTELGGKPSSSKGFHIIQCLLQVLMSEKVPVHLKLSVQYILSSVTDQNVLVNLLPVAKSIFAKIGTLKAGMKLDFFNSMSLYYILLRFNPESSSILETEAGWDIFISAANCAAPVLELTNGDFSPQSILMEQVMSTKFFKSIRKEELQVRLWNIFISRVAESEDPNEAAQLRKGLLKVSIDAKLISTEIAGLELTTKVTSIRAAQAKRIKQKAKENESNTLLAWKKLGLMLETIGVMASLGRPWLLVGPLCQCLHQTFTADVSIVEISQQQLLSALLVLTQNSLAELGEDCNKQVKLNIETVVQCIRSSTSPDTHRRALLLLSLAATIFPEVVMHNMMSIFTFMGTSLLRRDDSYSFQVIHQTIESIIPTLIKCEKKENLQLKLAQVCQVFTDALPDLPEHRRLPLFIQLANKIDSKRNLWLILAQACNMHGIRGHASESKDDDKKGVPKNVQFALTLSSQFPVATQVHSCCQLMEYIINLPHERKEGEVQKSDIINWKSYTTKQLCHFKYTCVGLIGHLLTSDTFVDQVCNESDWSLGDLCKRLLEKTLWYLRTVTELCESDSQETSGKFWSALQRKLILVLDGINAILPPSMLLDVIGGLIQSPWPVVRCRALELLCSKLQPTANYFSEANADSLIGFAKKLEKVCLDSREKPETRQTGLYALQLVVRFAGPHVADKVTRTLEKMTNLVHTKDIPDKVKSQGLLVIAEAVGVLKVQAVPLLSNMVQSTIDLITEDKEMDYLVMAALTVIYKLIENVPQFMSPYLCSLLCSVCHLAAVKEETTSKESRIIVRLTAVRNAAPEHIETRIFIPAFTEAFKTLAAKDLPAIQPLLEMADIMISKTDRKTLPSHVPDLLTLFTGALEIRTTRGSADVICQVEMSVISTLVNLLLRLNEQNNLAVFSSMYRWAVESNDDKPSRFITFYRFADHLANTLKVLFVKARLADVLFDHSVSMLKKNNTSTSSKTVFGNDRKDEKMASYLLTLVLDTLTKVFSYDSINFLDENKFKIVLEPLINQLHNKLGGESVTKERTDNHLIPCIVKLTATTADDLMWKEINSEIFQRIRSENDPKVILAGLAVFAALAEGHGEDYLLPILPEVIPAITEILEHGDEEVEEASRKTFAMLEEMLGEQVRAYLND